MDANRLFDQELILQHRLRAANQAPAGSAFLLDIVANELAERLEAVERTFGECLALHAHNGLMAELLSASDKVGRVYRLEQHPRFLDDGKFHDSRIVSHLDALPIAPGTLGLLAAPLSLHLVNDLPGLLAQIRMALQPDGLFLAALPGSGTLSELRDALLTAEAETTQGASPRVIPFADIRDCGSLLQRAGFALPVVDAETHIVRYDTLFGLLKDLRHMGMANPLVARSKKPVHRSFFMRAAQIYAERHADADGRIRATFNIVYLSGWKPHESQQKPLRPGSATTSLATALGTHEEKL